MNRFRDHYFRTYSVKTWTFQNLFCVFIYFLIFAVPFYVSFGGSNFWFDAKFDQLKVKYSYTGFYAIQVVSLSSSAIITEQYSNTPYSSMNGLTTHTIDVEDHSANTSITLQLTNFNSKTIQSINGIIYYDIEIPEFDRILSCGYSFSLSGDVSIASVYGQITLSTSEPINALTQIEAKTVNPPAYYTINYRGASSFMQLVESQLKNPYIIQGSKDYTRSVGSESTREITLNLFKDQEVIVPFYPSILETFKFKYSRYFGFLLLAYLIFRGLMVMLIQQEGLQCNIKDQKPPYK